MVFSSRSLGIHYKEGRHEPGKPNKEMIQDLADLLETAEASVHAVSGRLPFFVYGGFGIPDILKRKLASNVSISIISGNTIDQESKDLLLDLGAHLFQLEYRPRQHFVIVDSKHLRVESAHISEYDFRKQWTIYDHPGLKKYIEMFDDLKRKAKEVDGRKK